MASTLDQAPTQEPQPTYPAGFENWPSEEKEAFLNNAHTVRASEPTAENKTSVESDQPEWKQGEDWVKFEDLRKRKAREDAMTKAQNMSFITETPAQMDYREQKKMLAEKIGASLRAEMGDGPLTPEQEATLKAKTNDAIFAELVAKENEAYVKELKNNREETWGDKAKEGLRYALGTKALQWYIKQNKWVRLGLSTALATGVGYGLGTVAAAGAIGYGGARLARGAASFAAAGSVNKFLQEQSEYSIEQMEKNRQAEVEKLKNSDMSLEEKSRQLSEINERSDREKKKAAIVKGVLTVAAGSAGGMFAGITEHVSDALNGFNNTVSVPEEAPNVEFKAIPKVESVEAEVVAPNPPVSVTLKPEDIQGIQIIKPEMIFPRPEELVREVKTGDSVWRILEDSLKKSEQFENLNPAQKTFVLSSLTNKMLETPYSFGLEADGSLVVGKKLDLNNFFDAENQKETTALFAEAKTKIVGGKADTILANNKTIEDFVKAHPDTVLTKESVAEILNAKPEVEIPTEGGGSEATPEPVAEVKMEESPLPKAPDLASEIAPVVIPEVIDATGVTPAVPKFEPVQADVDPNIKLASGAGLAGAAALSSVRSPASDLRSMQNMENSPQVSQALFRKGIHKIFGSNGVFLGIGREEGVNTKEWKTINSFDAKELVQYTKGEAERSALSPKLISALQSSKARHFIEDLVLLREESGEVLDPYEKEKPAEYMVRLIEFVSKHNRPKAEAVSLPKAA